MGLMQTMVPANDADTDAAAAANDGAAALSIEAALLRRAAAGDNAAFARLIGGLLHPALGVAIRILGDSGRAEDAVQEAVAKLWQSAARFDPARGSFAGWWRRILVNSALDSRRRLRPVAALDEVHEIADTAPDPQARAESTELARMVQQAMARLPDRQRAALALFHGDGCDMKEIAAAIGTTPKAVEGLLLRGRAALRESLAHLKEEMQ